MIIDIDPKFDSALPPTYDLEVKVTDINFMLNFYRKVLKILFSHQSVYKSFDGRVTLNILVSTIPIPAYDLQVKVPYLESSVIVFFFFFKSYYSFRLSFVFR